MPGPLDRIRVLDFTWALAGPFGTMILSDLGAEVWKVEPVGITEAQRGPGPMVDGTNTYFFSVNRGKHSICLDLKSERGRELALQLAERADVVTENFSPGTMKDLKLDYAAVSARNPRIIYASTSGFGQTGPYAHRGAVDVIVQAMGGVMSITGHPGGPPARPGYSIGDMAGGMFTAIGVLSALVERQRSGLGQYIDVSMLDSQVALLENAVVRYFATGEVPGPIGTRHPLVTPFQAFSTADGHLVIAGVKDWEFFCAAMGLDSLVTDERFASNQSRTANHAALEPILEAAFRQRHTVEWLAILEPVCLVAPLNDIQRMANDPQVQHRGMLSSLPAPAGGRLTVSGSPVKLSRTPAGPTEGADSPGGHSDSLLAGELGYSAAAIAELRDAGVIA
jgi:CoA:oxalate CoA-transferase